MEEYIRRIQRKNRVKKYFITTFIIILITILMALTYILYFNIETPTQIIKPYEASKISQTVEETKKENETITQMLERVTESVVGISKLKSIGNSIFLKDGTSKLGLGTGIIVSENGYILTNEHVSGEKYSNCYVTLATGKSYQGNVVWSSTDLDLAIVKINAKNLQYITLGNSSDVKLGQIVYAIGNPIGFEFQRTVTSGIVSATNRTIILNEDEKSSYMENLIQTDATINPGNSGGPLVNESGEVIGINSVKITSAEGIGFAIPINIVKTIIQSFVTSGEFEEAYLGVFAYDKNIIPYLDNNLEIDDGIYVVQVNNKSSAEMYGIKEKDILLEVDGIALEKMCDLRSYIYTKKPGDEVIFKVLRNKREENITVKLLKK